MWTILQFMRLRTTYVQIHIYIFINWYNVQRVSVLKKAKPQSPTSLENLHILVKLTISNIRIPLSNSAKYL